jgi:hypothetical protein
MTPAVVPRHEKLLGLLGRVRDTNPAVNEFFVRFCSLGIRSHRDTAAKHEGLREDIAGWVSSGGGLGSSDWAEALRNDMRQLFYLLDAEMDDG